MGAARIEPHIQYVGHALIIGQSIIAAEIFLRAFVGPTIDAVFAYAGDDARIDARVVEILVGSLFHKKRDWDAPCALTRQHPVGAAFDHRRQAIAPLFRDEARCGDGLHRTSAQRIPLSPCGRGSGRGVCVRLHAHRLFIGRSPLSAATRLVPHQVSLLSREGRGV